MEKGDADSGAGSAVACDAEPGKEEDDSVDAGIEAEQPEAAEPEAGEPASKVGPEPQAAEEVRPSEDGAGLGFGTGAGVGLPIAASVPQSFTPTLSASPSSAVLQGDMRLTSIREDGPEQPGLDEERRRKLEEMRKDLPPRLDTYREGHLKTTVNTPEALILEAEEDEVLDPEQYMMFAQQYAALAQQYAAYAQYCAQYAPQAGASSSGSGSGQQGQQQPQQQQQRNAPIMVTPYRHNWLISGSHNQGGASACLSSLRNDIVKSVTDMNRYVSGRSCPSCPFATQQCKQM